MYVVGFNWIDHDIFILVLGGGAFALDEFGDMRQGGREAGMGNDYDDIFEWERAVYEEVSKNSNVLLHRHVDYLKSSKINNPATNFGW